MASYFGSRIAETFGAAGVPDEGVEVAEKGLGQALEVASRAPASLGAQLADAAKEAFVGGMHRGAVVAAVAVAIGAVVAYKWLPARAPFPEVELAPESETVS